MILSDKTLMKMLDEHTLIVDPLEIDKYSLQALIFVLETHTVL